MDNQEFKAGDTVVITEASVFDELYFKVGDKAVLLYEDDDGDWWADFKTNGNYLSDGEWCLQDGYTEFELFTEEEK